MLASLFSQAATTSPDGVQVSLSTVLSVGASVVGVLVAAYVALLRYAFSKTETNLKEEIAKAAKLGEEAKAENARQLLSMHAQQIDLLMTKSELALIKQAHTGLAADIAEIKDQQVPRKEWESWTKAMDQQFNQIMARLNITGRYKYPSDEMPATPQPKKGY